MPRSIAHLSLALGAGLLLITLSAPVLEAQSPATPKITVAGPTAPTVPTTLPTVPAPVVPTTLPPPPEVIPDPAMPGVIPQTLILQGMTINGVKLADTVMQRGTVTTGDFCTTTQTQHQQTDGGQPGTSTTPTALAQSQSVTTTQTTVCTVHITTTE